MSDNAELEKRVQNLEYSSRINALTLTIFFGFVALSGSLSIGQFERIFSEMLPPGTRLPLVTEWIIYGKWFHLFLIIALVTTAIIGSFIIRRANHGSLLVLGCNIALFLLIIITWIGLFHPFIMVLTCLTST